MRHGALSVWADCPSRRCLHLDPELAMVMVGTCGPLNGTASTSSGSRTLRYVLFFSFSSPPSLSLAESCVRVPAVKDANRMKTLLAWTLLLKPSMACLSVCAPLLCSFGGFLGNSAAGAAEASGHQCIPVHAQRQVRLTHRGAASKWVHD